MSGKIIKVGVWDKQLDALEDLLYIKLTKKEEERARKRVKKLWQLLVEAYETGKAK
jgi:hypothetical protein